MPGARDNFSDTAQWVDPAAGGAMKPLDNAQITVYLGGTSTKATLYSARDQNNNAQITNPFITGAQGIIEFWAEQGEYDIVIADLNVPARTATRTMGWGSMPAPVGGLRANSLAGDGGLPFAAQDAVTMRQHVPLGAVIDWWRPATTIPVPTGWRICDGSAVAAADHDFAGVTTFNMPDLRNAFVLGANTAAADGAGGAATPSNAATAAPGIGGKGGAQLRDLSHAHTMAHTHTFAHTHEHAHTHTIAHTHSVSVPAHYHGTGTLNITASGSHGHTASSGGMSANATHNHGGGTGDAQTYGMNSNSLHRHTSEGGGHFFQSGAGDNAGQVAAGNGWNKARSTDYANIDHTHTVPSLSISTVNLDHSHSISVVANDHTHPNSTFGGVVGNNGGSNGDAAMALTSGASSAASSGSASTDTTGQPSTSTTSASSAASTGTAGDPAQDMRPQYVGLLKLMKIKRS